MHAPTAAALAAALTTFLSPLVAQVVTTSATATTELRVRGTSGPTYTSTLPIGSNLDDGYSLLTPFGFPGSVTSRMTVTRGETLSWQIRETIGLMSVPRSIRAEVGSHARSIRFAAPSGARAGHVEITLSTTRPLGGAANATVDVSVDGTNVLAASGPTQQTVRVPVRLDPSNPTDVVVTSTADATVPLLGFPVSIDVALDVRFVADSACATRDLGVGCGGLALSATGDARDPARLRLSLDDTRTPVAAALAVGTTAASTPFGPHRITGEPCILWHDASSVLTWPDTSGRPVASLVLDTAALAGFDVRLQAATIDGGGIVSLSNAVGLRCP